LSKKGTQSKKKKETSRKANLPIDWREEPEDQSRDQPDKGRRTGRNRN